MKKPPRFTRSTGNYNWADPSQYTEYYHFDFGDLTKEAKKLNLEMNYHIPLDEALEIDEYDDFIDYGVIELAEEIESYYSKYRRKEISRVVEFLKSHEKEIRIAEYRNKVGRQIGKIQREKARLRDISTLCELMEWNYTCETCPATPICTYEGYKEEDWK